jgi:hypothetical protein
MRHKAMKQSFDMNQFFLDQIEQAFDTLVESASYKYNISGDEDQFAEEQLKFTAEFISFCCQYRAPFTSIPNGDSSNVDSKSNNNDSGNVVFDDGASMISNSNNNNSTNSSNNINDNVNNTDEISVENRLVIETRNSIPAGNIDHATMQLSKFANRLETLKTINLAYYWPELLDQINITLTEAYAEFYNFYYDPIAYSRDLEYTTIDSIANIFSE